MSELPPSERHVLLLRELLQDTHILLERCHKAVKEMQGSNDYDARTRSLALQEFAERLTASASGLRQAALHPPAEGRLLEREGRHRPELSTIRRARLITV